MHGSDFSSIQMQGTIGLLAMLIPAVICMFVEACEWIESIKDRNRK